MAHEEREQRLYDVRLRTRLLNSGMITQEELNQFIASIPDCSDNAETSEVSIEDHPEPRTVVMR